MCVGIVHILGIGKPAIVMYMLVKVLYFAVHILRRQKYVLVDSKWILNHCKTLEMVLCVDIKWSE
jgi:hypothetical protein